MAAKDSKARNVAILAAGAGMLGMLSSMAVIFPRIDPNHVVAEEAALDPHSPFMPDEVLPNPPHPLSIALLPMEAEPGARVPEPLVEQLARDVTLQLGGMGLQVADDRAAETLRGRKTPPYEAGRTLGVRYVLAATVGGNEEDVRIHATLTDCATKRVLWNGTFWKTRRAGSFDHAEFATALRMVLPLNQRHPGHTEEF